MEVKGAGFAQFVGFHCVLCVMALKPVRVVDVVRG
jgi:hypothetical protein